MNVEEWFAVKVCDATMPHRIIKAWFIKNKKMKKYTFTEKKDTRSGFGAGMTQLGRTNPNVVALCADLVGSLK